MWPKEGRPTQDQFYQIRPERLPGGAGRHGDASGERSGLLLALARSRSVLIAQDQDELKRSSCSSSTLAGSLELALARPVQAGPPQPASPQPAGSGSVVRPCVRPLHAGKRNDNANPCRANYSQSQPSGAGPPGGPGRFKLKLTKARSSTLNDVLC